MYQKEFEPDPDKRDKCVNEIIFCQKNAKNNFLLTPLQKAPGSRWGLNAFCQLRDVAFWKGASGICRNGSTNNDRNTPGAMFFAAYVGPSMNPTLREPEMIEIVPYDNRSLRVGDVVFFLPPQNDQPVVHRVIRVTSAGISTLGDNNTREDTFLLQPNNIKGRVVAAWSGQKRRKIAGGLQGRLTSRRLRWLHILDRALSPLLHPLYRALSDGGVIARLLPAPIRPRVAVFHAQGRDQFQLLLGQRIIGRYDDQRRQWQIQRPFRLFVDGKALSGQKDKERTGLE